MRTHRRFNTIVLALAFLLVSTFALYAGTGSTWSLRIEGDDFVIVRGGNTSCEETVLYRTVSLSAIAGQHFTDTSGSVTFGPGATTKRITVDLLSPSADNYNYQVGSKIRSFRFEVTEPGGNILTSIDRSISTGTNVPAGTFGIKDITVDSGTITVKDKNYIQGYHSVPIQTYFNSVSKSYLQFLNASLRMTLTFQAAEEDDGYQHVQILVNYTGNPDEGSGNDNPGTMENSTYMACFVHQGGSTNKTYASYSFPVQSAGDSCGTVATPWSSLGNSIGELRQQYFKSGSRATDGRLILPLNLTALRICFDASGKNDDTWYAQNTVAHIQAIDTTAPTRLSDPVVSSGYHAKGNIFYVSIPFSEIVKVTGTPSLSTTWGTLDYCYGSNTNVLTFSGTITADPGTQLKVNSISGTVTDLAGNELTAKTINKTFSSMTVDAAVTYTITFDSAGGSEVSSQTYTYDTADLTLSPAPTLTGYRFDGWTGNNVTEAQTSVTVPQHSFGNLTYTAHWTDVWGMNTNPNGGPLYPYLITSPDGLVLLAECIARDGSYATKTFVLEADIDMSGISDFGIGTESYPFRGKIDGNNHVIRNLVLGSSSQSTVGLIRYFLARLQNLIIDGATVEGADNTGIAVGAFVVENGISGRVNDCYVFNSSITCANSYGIFSADNSGTFSNSHYRNVTINGADPVSDIFTITKDSGLTISTEPTVTYQQIDYYTQGSAVTVTSADPERYALSSVTVTYGENSIEATKVDDYTFSFTMPSADIQITAVRTPVEYTITYDLGGGTATNNASYHCETETFTLNNPTRTGYRFDGWTGSNGDTPETTVTISPGGYGNLTYTAHWTDVWGIERGGDGYALWPYKITTPDGLVLLAECIARDGSYAGKVFVLEADIDMSGISDFGIGTESYPFTGKIDGNNHVIRNLVLGSPTQSPVGLSRYSNKASLMNLIIDGATVKGADNTGIIVGANNDGRISNCYIFNSSIDSANAYGIFTAGTGNINNSHYRNVTING
ncbi:MAG: InlB B-repeat-containing protein, partial [Spirochaetales bacterium]|nr:InlB B-repeat-containing protein [Spirochaetales bacterium]